MEICTKKGKIWTRGSRVAKMLKKLVISDSIVYNRIYLEVYEEIDSH